MILIVINIGTVQMFSLKFNLLKVKGAAQMQKKPTNMEFMRKWIRQRVAI